MKLKASARDFGRVGDIEQLGEMHSMTELPTYYYDYRRFDLPLTTAEVEQEFGRNIQLFNTNEVTDGSRQTNAETGSGVNEGFLACGMGITAFGEGEAFSVTGVRRENLADGDTPLLSNARDLGTECYCGVVNLESVTEGAQSFATLWWGAPTWRFIEKFFQAYRLEIKINRRFQIVDESLLDIGMTPVPPKFIGASDSTIQPMPFIRAVNDTMTAKGITGTFLTANSIVDMAEGATVVRAAPPPLVPVTYGHPWIAGVSNKLYCFSTPILFIPGMRFDISFVNIENATVYDALTNTITAACITAREGLNADVDETVGDAGLHCVVPGGSVSLGSVFKGVGLQPQACVQYLLHHFSGGSLHGVMYREVANSVGIINQAYVDQSLRGQLAGWLKGQ